MPLWPPPCGEVDFNGRLTATDALHVLRAAVGLEQCLLCLCDADGDGRVTATDALRVLARAVGQQVSTACPACPAPICGDGFVNQAGEECDGSDDAACPGLCKTDCTCAQPVCGDGIVNRTGEECDGADDDACPTLCQSDCTCPEPFCGNDVREAGEVCDGTDLGGQTCTGLGFSGGTLACTSDCAGYDSSGCTLPTALPPDPTTVAPPVDPQQPADVKSVTEFLIDGPNRVQYGVSPETIERRRAAVVRGAVFGRGGAGLPGVVVKVHGHPELGRTQTRADGRFDLVVNGGGTLVLDYSKDGYLPAQRHVHVPWQQYVAAPDVVLIPLDAQATAVDLSGSAAAVQVARGSTVTDDRGTRQATLVVPAQTSGEMVLADGSRVPLSSATVRLTEYTVGQSGPEAMPGELPPGIGYTYAV
ncbi:MAG: hypothetical protein D6760_08220, partial [Deltaproteobacteria bacterium]